MATSKARVDASQVETFQRRLALTAQLIDEEGEAFEQHWGGLLADELRARVPVSDDPPHLRDAIAQIEPGGITFGDQAHVGRFLDRGTVNMAPKPFIQPAIKQIRTPARKDAGKRAIDLIMRGR